MRKRREDVLKISAGFLAGAMAISLSLGTADIAQAKKKVTINKKKVTLKVGKTVKLRLKGLNAKQAKKVKWSSKNKAVATVNKKGLVTAKKKGLARIIAKVGKKSYVCRITVKSSSSSSSKSSSVDWDKVSSNFDSLAEYVSSNGTSADEKVTIQNSATEGDEEQTVKVSYDPSNEIIIFEKKSVSSDGDGVVTAMTLSKEDPEVASLESQIIQEGETYIGTTEIEIADYAEEDEALGFSFGDSSSDEDSSSDSEEDSSSDSEDSDSSKVDDLDALASDFFNSALSEWNDYLSDAGTGTTLPDLGFVSFQF